MSGLAKAKEEKDEKEREDREEKNGSTRGSRVDWLPFFFTTSPSFPSPSLSASFLRTASSSSSSSSSTCFLDRVRYIFSLSC